MGTSLHSLVGGVWEFVSEAVGTGSQECIGWCTCVKVCASQAVGLSLSQGGRPEWGINAQGKAGVAGAGRGFACNRWLPGLDSI